MGWLRRLLPGLRKHDDSHPNKPAANNGDPAQVAPEDTAHGVAGIDIGAMWEQYLNDPEILREHFGVNSMAELGQLLSDADKDMQGRAIRSAMIDEDTCPTCRELDGKVVKLDSPEFREFMPPKGCTARECRCEYVVSSLDQIEMQYEGENEPTVGDKTKRLPRIQEYAPPKLVHTTVAPCPYCSAEMNPTPRRKKKCRACGAYVFVRTRQEVFPSPYLTEAQAIAVDRFATLAQWGVTADEFRKGTERGDSQTEDRALIDAVYTLAHRLLAATDDRGQRSMILREVATFRKVDGQDWITPLRESERQSLLFLQEEGVEEVVIDAEDCCDVCRKHHGRRLTVSNALELMVVPDPECTGNPICICHHSDLV